MTTNPKAVVARRYMVECDEFSDRKTGSMQLFELRRSQQIND
jgi:hypothetical protein